MRVRTALAVLVLGAVVTACSPSGGRALARYYDPQGLFSADLPAANSLSVQTATSGQGASAILSGVVATPPQPSASPSSAIGDPLGVGGIGQTAPGDQTMYEVFVVTTNAFRSLDSMTLYFLTGDPAIDVREEQPIAVADSDGRLVVADIHQSGALTASVAVAFTLGTNGVGYLVAAIFPPGDWANQQADFSKIVASVRPNVPSGVATFPLTNG